MKNSNVSINHYKVLDLPLRPNKNSVYYVLDTSLNVVRGYITDLNGIPIKFIDLSGNVNSVTGTGVTGTLTNPKVDIATFVSAQLGNLISLSTDDGKLVVKPITSPDGSLEITETVSELQIELSSAILSQINTALQPGGNISELVNDAGYLISADFSNVVYVNSTNPSTATIFDLNNPPIVNDDSLKEDVSNLYIGTDGSTWTYKTSPAGYNTYNVASGSNFYLSGGTIDAGSNKINAIKRNGSIEATALIATNETINTIASFDSNKNIKSLSTVTYPNLLELSYIKGASSTLQIQIDNKQIIDTQIEISANGNVQNSWHGQTVLFTSNCTITVPASLNNSLMFPFRTLAGVTVTWAITSPFVWETTPSATPEKTVGHFMRRGNSNTIFLDV